MGSMADQSLSEAERRFRETGLVEDEAAWLQKRVRAGELAEDHVRVAALFGHHGAQQAGFGTVPAPAEWVWAAPLAASTAQGLATLAWLHGGSSSWDEEGETRLLAHVLSLRRLSRHAAARAAIVVAGLCYQPEFDSAEALAALHAAEAWATSPSREAARAARATVPGAVLANGGSVVFCGVARAAARTTWSGPWRAAKLAAGATHAAFLATGLELHPGDVFQAIADKLVPWALGYGDPVRDRVEARRG